MRFGYLVPPGSPPPNSKKPIPGTGPYMISRLEDQRAKGVILVRNPHFHQWSADAGVKDWSSE